MLTKPYKGTTTSTPVKLARYVVSFPLPVVESARVQSAAVAAPAPAVAILATGNTCTTLAPFWKASCAARVTGLVIVVPLTAAPQVAARVLKLL